MEKQKTNKVEVIVASMHQNDFSLVNRMNLKTDIIIGNQADYESIEHLHENGKNITRVSTKTRGVGVNRNIALEFSEGDYILFADEDCIYPDDLETIVQEAFKEYPRAEVVLFGIQFTKNGVVYQKRIPKRGRINRIKSMKYGACSIAIRKDALKRKNLHFSELFGGGCIYSHGEDSDFIIQCFNKHLKVYAYDKIICTTAKDTSTCFEGYTKKYFYDVGALAQHSFGRVIKYLYIIYIAFRIKETDLSIRQKFYYLFKGMRQFRALIPFNALGE